MIKRLCPLLIVLIIFSTYLHAQEKDVEIALEKGIEQYMVGDFLGAIRIAEGILKINPEHPQAKELLLRSLKRMASQHYKEGNYKEAIPYLERAGGLYPQDEEVKTLLEDSKSKIETEVKEDKKAKEEKEKAARERALWKEKLAREKKSQSGKWKQELARRKAGDLKRWEEELANRKKKEEDEMLASLGINEREWEMKLANYKRAFKLGGALFLVITLIFVVGIFVWGRRLSQIRDITQYQIKEEVLRLISQKAEENFAPLKEEEDKILAQTEKILQIEDRIAKSLEEKISQLDEKQTHLVEEKIAQISDQQKSLVNEQTEKMLKLLEVNQEQNLIGAQNRVLDLLEKTSLLAVPDLVEQWKREQFSSAQAQTTPSTHVLKVTQRAKELYEAAPEEALKLLGKLSGDTDRWVRISVVSALNEIDEPEGVDILLGLLKDREKSVKTAAYQALERKVARGRDALSEELAKKILDALRQSPIR